MDPFALIMLGIVILLFVVWHLADLTWGNVNPDYVRGDVYPDGPMRPPSAIQRGSVMFLSHVPGDPSTPGWPSTPGAKRCAATVDCMSRRSTLTASGMSRRTSRAR